MRNKKMTDEELVRRARAVINPRKISHGLDVGDVGCALLTGKDSLHVGVSIDAVAGIGFCAEHSAIASMVTHGEQSISKIVAVTGDGTILPPCGRCREFMYQIDRTNLDRTEVIIGNDKVVKLRDLLPHPWDGGSEAAAD